jgi:hypothetical protein
MSQFNDNGASINIRNISADDLVWISESDPNGVLDEFGNRPLHFAAKDGTTDLIKRIFELGADASRANLAGVKASEIARESGNLQAALLLRSYERLALNSPSDDASFRTTVGEVNKTGSFKPTPSTRLLENEADWDIPEITENNPIDEGVENNSHNNLRNIQEISISEKMEIQNLFNNLYVISVDINNNIRKIAGYILKVSWKIDKITWNYSGDISDELRELSQNISDIVYCMDSYTDVIDGDLFDNEYSSDIDIICNRGKFPNPTQRALANIKGRYDDEDLHYGRGLRLKILKEAAWSSEHWAN